MPWKNLTILIIRRALSSLPNFGPRDNRRHQSDHGGRTRRPILDGARSAKQTITDAGPLPPHPNMDPKAKFNMEDVDDELVRRSVGLHRPLCESKQAVLPLAQRPRRTSRVDPSLAEVAEPKVGSVYMRDGHDWSSMQRSEPYSRKLTTLGIANNTIVVFTSGQRRRDLLRGRMEEIHHFGGEKGTTFEGGFRVPMVAKWPGTISPGSVWSMTSSPVRTSCPTLFGGGG